MINTSPEVTTGTEAELTISDLMKDLLSDSSKRIKLDDFVSQQVRKFLATSDLRQFPVQGSDFTPDNFIERIGRYEQVTKDLQHIVILLSKWGEGQQLRLLEKVFTRLGEADKGSSGLIVWLRLTWYPVILLMYSAGISALASGKYEALRIVLMTMIQPDPESGKVPQALIVPAVSQITQLHDEFKLLPGQEQKYVPRSEHLFKTVQPNLEDELLVGRGYEGYFDEFETLAALVYVDITGRDWGPPGRFAWKFSRGYGTNPFEQIIQEAKAAGPSWGPLSVGLFNGSLEHFLNVAERYRVFLKKLGWF